MRVRNASRSASPVVEGFGPVFSLISIRAPELGLISSAANRPAGTPYLFRECTCRGKISRYYADCDRVWPMYQGAAIERIRAPADPIRRCAGRIPAAAPAGGRFGAASSLLYERGNAVCLWLRRKW